MSVCCEEVFSREPETVEEVIKKMNVFEKFLQSKDKHGFLPFLRAYRKITEKVKYHSDRGLFNSPEKLEDLDVRFAELYFNAMESYFIHDKKRKPWKNYINYVENSHSRPLLELVLGINAHINADLAIVLDEIDYDEKEDFEKVNKILLEALYPVIADTAISRKDLEAFTFLGTGPLPLIGLKKITVWREKAWNNNRDRENILIETEGKASDMISIRHDRSLKGFFEKPMKILEA